MGFDEIYERYFDFVWRSVRRLGVPEAAADDVAQDVFLIIYRRLATFEGRASMTTWMFEIARRVVADYRRSSARRDARLARATNGADLQKIADPNELGPLGAVLREEAARALSDVLDGMAEARRRVFVLAEIEGVRATEIARAFGENVNTIYSRIRAARREFEALAERRTAHDFAYGPADRAARSRR